MSEAEKYLNNHKDGYNSHKIHEILHLPKIKIQALMQEFSDHQLKSKVKAISDDDITVESLNNIMPVEAQVGFKAGVKWFKRQILKTIE